MELFEEVFVAAGTVRVSEAALQVALEFADAVGAGPGGRRLVAFDWAQSVSIQKPDGSPPTDVGACLMLGAYQREEVPGDCIERAGRYEYAIKMPREVLAQCVERRIDIDGSKPFQLALF